MIASQRQSQGCFCAKYYDQLAENARLKDEVERLESKLPRQERTAKEQSFGLSTPSSKQLVKPSPPPEFDEAEITRRKDGAAPGHAGRGWKEPGGPAPEVEDLEAPDACPCCAGPAGRLKAALDLYAQDQNTNLHSATFKGLMPTAPTQ